jgi:hypothetical protein
MVSFRGWKGLRNGRDRRRRSFKSRIRYAWFVPDERAGLGADEYVI